jgi:hypothetical protein
MDKIAARGLKIPGAGPFDHATEEKAGPDIPDSKLRF